MLAYAADKSQQLSPLGAGVMIYVRDLAVHYPNTDFRFGIPTFSITATEHVTTRLGFLD